MQYNGSGMVEWRGFIGLRLCLRWNEKVALKTPSAKITLLETGTPNRSKKRNEMGRLHLPSMAGVS